MSENLAELDLADLARRVRRLDRDNAELFRRLVEGEKRFRGLAKAVWRVQEEERRRLARELHDGLGQTLTALKIQIERLAIRADEIDTGLGGDLASAGEIAHGALQDARRLSHLLRPRMLDDLGLLPALRWLGRTITDGTGVEIALDLDGLADTEERFDPEFETLVFRVVQEASTNALKHSGAARIDVRLERRGRFLRLFVEDAGRGFDPGDVASADGGHGLAGIRDRVAIFGGRSHIESRPGEGTRIEILLPLGSDDPSESAGPGGVP